MRHAKPMLLRRRLCQLILCGALLANTISLCAQTSWTAVNSPTTQDLWSACFGSGQFVAVGTGGTILTSPDGNTWSQRTSGVNLWLVGVSYGNNLYVAVGDRGTILTSPDGVTWTQRTSGTTQRLNGVAYVPITNGSLFSSITRFVAVGEGGTVCTSVDGLTWTAGNVGVSGWLRGVSGVTTGDPGFQSSGAYVGGQQGTVLKCIDGLNFVPVSFPVFSDIGDLAVSRGFDILAVGAGGLIATGTVGSTSWSTQLVGTSFYRGALNAWIGPNYTSSIQVAVGSGGVIAIPVPGRTGSWMAIQLPKPADLFAVATNGTGTQIVAAGQGGTIWSSVGANPLGAVSLISPLRLIYTGADVTLQATNTGIAPTSYQWQFNGVPISGTTQPTLTLHNIQTSQSGTYSCTVNSATASITVSTQLTVQLLSITSTPNPAYVGNDVVLQGPVSTDATAYYQWQFNGVLIAGATQPTLTLHNIQAQQSGTYVCIMTSATASVSASMQLAVQLTPPSLGLVDLAFDAHLAATPGALLPLPDGRLLVAAAQNFVSAGQTQYGLARLNSDGSVDSTFGIGSGLNSSGTITQFLLQPDGKVVIGGTFSTLNGLARPKLARLNLNGSLDATFAPDTSTYDATLPLVRLADGRFLQFTISSTTITVQRLAVTGVLDATYPPTTFPRSISWTTYFPRLVQAVDASNRVLVGISATDDFDTSTATQLARFNPDGTLDGTFVSHDVPHALVQLVAVQDKFTYEASSVYYGGMHLSIDMASYVGRLNANGALDPSLPEKTVFRFSGMPDQNQVWPAVALLPDGSAVLTQSNPNRLIRYDTAGQLDRNFSAYADATITRLTPLPDGRLLATGSFTSINGVPRAFLARLTPDTHAAATRLTSISVRANAGSGDQTLIVGISVSGSGQKALLVRGVGPGLAAYGVNGTLADPQFTLFNGSTVVLTNDNWSDGADSANIAAVTARVQDFPLAPGSKDAAAVATLAGGLYTTHITGHSGTGVALAEAYDADPAPADFNATRVVSFSARTQAGATDQTLIAGFVVDGPDARRLLIRAVGPGLTAYGVSGVLADPVLTLYQGNTVIAANDDWNSDTSLGAALQTAAQQTGAFALSVSSKDAALLVTLPPGVYTAQVSGKNGTTGVALVEVYEAP